MDIGAWLLLAFFGWLIWLVIKRYKAGKGTAPRAAPGKVPNALEKHEKMLAVLRAQDQDAEVFAWPADCGHVTEVVGESFYTDALSKIVGPVGDKTTGVDATATLIPYDFKPGEKAIGVVINGMQVGHLSRDDVDEYLEALERHGQAGKVAQCKAEVSGRIKRGKPIYWVELDLDVMAGDD